MFLVIIKLILMVILILRNIVVCKNNSHFKNFLQKIYIFSHKNSPYKIQIRIKKKSFLFED